MRRSTDDAESKSEHTELKRSSIGPNLSTIELRTLVVSLQSVASFDSHSRTLALLRSPVFRSIAANCSRTMFSRVRSFVSKATISFSNATFDLRLARSHRSKRRVLRSEFERTTSHFLQTSYVAKSLVQTRPRNDSFVPQLDRCARFVLHHSRCYGRTVLSNNRRTEETHGIFGAVSSTRAYRSLLEAVVDHRLQSRRVERTRPEDGNRVVTVRASINERSSVVHRNVYYAQQRPETNVGSFRGGRSLKSAIASQLERTNILATRARRMFPEDIFRRNPIRNASSSVLRANAQSESWEQGNCKVTKIGTKRIVYCGNASIHIYIRSEYNCRESFVRRATNRFATL